MPKEKHSHATSWVIVKQCDVRLFGISEYLSSSLRKKSRFVEQKISYLTSKLNMISYDVLFWTFDSTPLHVSIQKETQPIFQLLLEKGGAALEMKSTEGFPPLWYALNSPNQEFSMASKLLEYGASADTICDEDSNTLLHCLIAEEKEKAALFLLQQRISKRNRRPLASDNFLI